MVELRRIELLTPCLQSRRSPKLSYSPVILGKPPELRLVIPP